MAFWRQRPSSRREKYHLVQNRIEAFTQGTILIKVLDDGIKKLYSVAAGVVEGKLILELKNKLKSVQSFFTAPSNTVKRANKNIDAAKSKLTTEIVTIREIKTETEITRFYADYGDLMLSLLKEATRKVVSTCNEYQKRHSKKTLFEVSEV